MPDQPPTTPTPKPARNYVPLIVGGMLLAIPLAFGAGVVFGLAFRSLYRLVASGTVDATTTPALALVAIVVVSVVAAILFPTRGGRKGSKR